MRKAIFLKSVLLILFFIFNVTVSAHPGRTAADGCHYCRTNCDYWGVSQNERHCHGGGAIQTTNTPTPLPTWTPVPTYIPIPTNTPTPTLTNTPTPKPTESVLGITTKKATKKTISKKKTVKKKTFWQWLFNK